MKRLLPLLLLLAGPAQAATVVSVGDGDTLRLNDAGRLLTVRLACIDAPETAQRPYGQASRAAFQALAPIGSDLTLRSGGTDRYGRTIGELWRGSTNLNLSLVRQGQAFAYRQYLKAPCNPAAYLEAERQAESQRLGVWQVPGGITRPWSFRRGGRSSSSSTSSSGRLTCRSIGSYARAQDLLRQGHTYLDRDGDGQACESLR